MFNSIYRDIHIGNMSYFFIMDGSGYIYKNNQEIITRELTSNPQIINLIKNKNKNTILFYHNNERFICIYNTSDKFDFKVIEIIPYKEIRQKLSQITLWGVKFCLIYTVIIVIIADILTITILKPLRNLLFLMEQANQYEKLDLQATITGADEISYLTEQFNDMILRLNTLINENYKAKIRENKFAVLQKEAQLNALQQQINPHFLYNTLELIKWMAYSKGAIDVCNVISALGDFFRGTISSNTDFVTIEQEIEHLNNYIYIQKIRYQGKLNVKLDIEDSIRDCKLLKLTLQPIVENAMIHGLEHIEYERHLSIIAKRKGDKVIIIVEDNGVGIEQEKLNKLKLNISSNKDKNSKSIGLKNVYKRLKLYYEDDFCFLVNSDTNIGTTISIEIPFQDI